MTSVSLFLLIMWLSAIGSLTNMFSTVDCLGGLLAYLCGSFHLKSMMEKIWKTELRHTNEALPNILKSLHFF